MLNFVNVGPGYGVMNGQAGLGMEVVESTYEVEGALGIVTIDPGYEVQGALGMSDTAKTVLYVAGGLAAVAAVIGGIMWWRRR